MDKKSTLDLLKKMTTFFAMEIVSSTVLITRGYIAQSDVSEYYAYVQSRFYSSKKDSGLNNYLKDKGFSANEVNHANGSTDYIEYTNDDYDKPLIISFNGKLSTDNVSEIIKMHLNSNLKKNIVIAAKAALRLAIRKGIDLKDVIKAEYSLINQEEIDGSEREQENKSGEEE